MISAIGLEFGGVMHITMKQIAIENGFARPIFEHSTELSMKFFHDRLGPGLRDDITALTQPGICWAVNKSIIVPQCFHLK